MSERLDEIDQALLRLLQADSRASYAAMAQEVGLSAAAVRKRVNRLFERGIVRGLMIVDPMAVGVDVAVLVGIKHHGPLGTLGDTVQGVQEVMWAAVTSGRYDLVVELGCSSAEHLISTLNIIRNHPAVVDVDVINILQYVKFDQQPIQPHPHGGT